MYASPLGDHLVSGLTGPMQSIRAFMKIFFCFRGSSLNDLGSLVRVMMTGALDAGVSNRSLNMGTVPFSTGRHRFDDCWGMGWLFGLSVSIGLLSLVLAIVNRCGRLL